MAEFNSGGFSAVDTFFEDGTDQEKLQKSAGLSNAVKSQTPQGRRRGGVGSAPPPKTAVHGDLASKLLKVGRKRGREGGDDEEDFAHEHHDDDEEEAGRTAINSKSKSKIPNESREEGTSSRKMGKKERRRMKEQAEATALDGQRDPEGDAAHNSSDGQTKEIEVGDLNEEKVSTKKNKRRKVRSKQKNIRKDTRETKPGHLIVGQKYYKGRPLTTETRNMLKLPPPKVRSPYVVESAHTGSAEGDGVGLAIDDLLEDTGKAVEGPKFPQAKKEKIQKKKKKYKNLKV